MTMTRIEQLNEATADILACERDLARRIEAGDIDDRERANLEAVIATSKAIVRDGLESVLAELRAADAPGLGSIEWLLDLARQEASQ